MINSLRRFNKTLYLGASSRNKESTYFTEERGDKILNVDQYIEERLENQISWYSKKSQHAQKMYKIFQITEIIIAAFIPLLSGYTTDCVILAVIVGICGAIIAVIESVSKLFKWHENWIEYRTTCELLKYHKYLHLTQSSPYNKTEESIDNLFIKNIEDIISSENNQWKINASAEPSKDNSTT